MWGPRRVFLSHTSELREFPAGRSFIAAAEAAVSRAQDAVTDMAYFTARDDKPAEYCQDRVRGCDVYVGLVGLRYGTPVRDRPEVSYTELEFATATEAGLERLVFLLDEDAAVPIPPRRLRDTEAGLEARQRAFRARLLESGMMAGKFATPEQLEVLLLQALQETRRQPEPFSDAEHEVGLPARPGIVGRDREGRERTIGLAGPIAVSVEIDSGPVLYIEGDEIVAGVPGFEEPRRAWADSWPLEDVTITVLVEAAVARTVILRNLRVVIDERREPPEGNLAIPLGVLPPRTFVIDLDHDDPRIVPAAGTPAFPYTVSQTDPEQFVIMASTRRYYVEWRLALDWTCQGQQGAKIIDWHEHPFRVGAAPESLRMERARRQA